MSKRPKRSMGITNPFIIYLLLLFLFTTGLISTMACHFAYGQKRAELLADLDKQLLRIAEEYKNITDNFWAIYLPIYEERDDTRALTDYFKNVQGNEDLLPVERFRLTEALSHMAARNEKVQWIAIYSPQRKRNYIFVQSLDTLVPLPEDFPYQERLSNKKRKMEIYPAEEIRINGIHFENISIVGGVPGYSLEGSILVGFDISRLKQLCETDKNSKTLEFGILQEGTVLYASDGQADWADMQDQGTGNIFSLRGKRWYVQRLEEQLREEQIFYAVNWWKLIGDSGENMAVIILITVFIAVLSIGMSLAIVRSLNREVDLIRKGLDCLEKNQLNYRITDKFYQPELSEIAEAINQMAENLRENIERTQEYEVRQRESEMQELQAKFNPHFLYNILEIFRVRCYQNNDRETGDLIAQTASIFRGFIDSRTFIPISEELAFGKRYLTLFRARYGDSVQILYDIDTEVLQYGIIRNVFQPLIENYFEHGYDPGNRENYFMIGGHILNESLLLFTVEDNGMGMEEEAVGALNAQLQRSTNPGTESYGLRNLHQRLRLFYGGDCGIILYSKKPKGLIIEMRILRWKVPEKE